MSALTTSVSLGGAGAACDRRQAAVGSRSGVVVPVRDVSRDCWTDFLRLAPRAGRGARGGAIWSATEGQKGRRQHDINVEDVVDAEDGET